MRDALAASSTEMVTVALRRADLSGKKDPFANILEFIDPKKYLLLPNTSGAMNAEEAVRLARLAASAGLPKWVKLEIHPDPRYLLPDPIETFKAAEILVKEGFTVLPYINADPVLAKRTLVRQRVRKEGKRNSRGCGERSWRTQETRSKLRTQSRPHAAHDGGGVHGEAAERVRGAPSDGRE